MTDFPQNSTQTLSPLQRAALTVQEMRTRIDQLERSHAEPIAIVGMGCRFPGGVTDPESFWNLLSQGKNAVGEIPERRRQLLGRSQPGYPQRGGFLDRIDEFDPDFFGISPREAATMDPQQRLLLEVSWETLENAGIAPSRLMDSQTGVFLGISLNEFLKSSLFGDEAGIDIYSATGNALSIAAGRIAHWLGVRGPALAVDTACSSSLVAVHLACQSLRLGECRLGVAGGIYLMMAPQTTLAMAKLNALSPDGYCKTFDASADGYGRGEGCGAIALKRLSDAQSDGDRILAVIRGSAVNHDGRSSGLTVPNGTAQQAVVRSALQNARVNPQDIQYIEAHGTGTPLGDPIEVRSLSAVLGENRQQPFAIGSVKTNIGHLEAAAGIAGLMKVVLAMQQGEIPQHLHFQQLNDRIDRTHITVPTERTPWIANRDGTRLAGISAFGFSGTNAHVILESAPEPSKSPKPARSPQLLCLSAKSQRALQQRVTDLAEYLRDRPELELAEICVTENAGRSHFSHRLAFCVSTRSQLQQCLETPSDAISDTTATPPLKIGFYFPPVSDRAIDIDPSLYESAPAFKAAIEACADCLDADTAALLLSVCQERKPENLPISVAVSRQVALTQLWRSWGIEPTVTVGDGIGAQVAAWASGQLNLPELFAQLPETLDKPGISDSAIASLQQADCDSAIALGTCETSTSNHLWLPSLDSQRTDWEVLLDSLRQLYLRGVDICWHAVEAGQQRQAIALPTYPFQRQSYDLPNPSPTAPLPPSDSLLGRRLSSPLSAIQFEANWHLDRLPLVRDHQLQGQPIANLAVYLEMLQAGAIATWNRPVRRWNGLRVPHPLSFSSDRCHRVQLILTPQPGDRAEFQIFSQPPQASESAPWVPHLAGEAQFTLSPEFSQVSDVEIKSLKQQFSDCWDGETFYQQMRSHGADLGASCQVLNTVWRKDGEALGQLTQPKSTLASEYHLPLQALDACFQVFAACVPPHLSDTYIILSLQQLELDKLDPQNPPKYAYTKIQTPVEDWQNRDRTATLSADVMLLTEAGKPVVKATELQLRRLNATATKLRSNLSSSPTSENLQNRAIAVPNVSQLSELSESEQLESIEGYLIAILAKLLRLPEDKLNRDYHLAELVDSLIAFELQGQIEKDFQIRLPIENFLGRSTIAQLANTLLEQQTLTSLVLQTRSSSESEEMESLIL
ncbi:type I polyketide synthase [Baaleninema simplex]|uniref:type I polyketide synthase n=1 Tax=Baaleninema simplex TaxID=2862350 RepID=UPI000346BC4D|nr:beta-ketoacyl synthase N-terminal-like domain-containing protein [Baaleninema simplex]